MVNMSNKDVLGGKCGCVWCRTGGAPTTRSGWMGVRNKRDRNFGNGRRGGKK